jgi:predicted MPP superfamily phosphohydrolase
VLESPLIFESWNSRKGKSMELGSVSRRRFLETASLFGLSSLSAGSSAYQLIASEEIEVTHHTIRLKNLPQPFDGLKLVHLTDIHHSKFVSFNDVFRMVGLSNQQDPDLVLLTGDYITWSKKFIGPVAEALRSLKSRLGVYAVLGNHDIRVSADQVTQALKKVQIEVLRNASARIDLGGDSLWIGGVDEYIYGQSDIPEATKDVPRSQPKILLAHNPEIMDEAAGHQVDFVLAGHTHGGQIKIPYMRSLNVVTQPGRKILEGFVRRGKTQMYISRGLGKVVVPVRIFCPPEIPVFYLRA